jgi:hypothetical protein
VPDEDPERPISSSADGDEDEDGEADGQGLGNDDDSDDDDDDDDDGSDEMGESVGSAKRKDRRKFLRPLPPWLEKPFKSHVEESSASHRDEHGRPPLYFKNNSFFFPQPSTIFLLRRQHVSPQLLYNPRFFLWDPEPLCPLGIPCPNCNKPLLRHSVIPRPRRVVDLDSRFWIIGYRYKCRQCVNPKTGKFGTLTFRSWNPRILAVLPPYLAKEFPAKLTHRSGISNTVFSFMRSCFQNGMGSKQFADALRVQHLLHFDYLHLQYLEFLSEHTLASWAGEKYKSFLAYHDRSPDGPHGFVPSAQWLRDLYDNFIEDHRPDFNQHMGMLTAEVAAIDHSHKVHFLFSQ